jgi:hypothetical protein
MITAAVIGFCALLLVLAFLSPASALWPTEEGSTLRLGQTSGIATTLSLSEARQNHGFHGSATPTGAAGRAHRGQMSVHSKRRFRRECRSGYPVARLAINPRATASIPLMEL